jgi:GTP-binding protein
MLKNPYKKAQFLKSAAKVSQLPEDTGYEVAFAGRSNAGKSSALNCLTENKQMAKTSKTPGRTQLINLFTLDETRRLVDLPGYGYAKVSQQIKAEWQKHLAHYLESRESLRGLILLMDIRHPLKELDCMMIDWSIAENLPVHILLTKADKLSRSDAKNCCKKVSQYYAPFQNLVSVQSFSATKQSGLESLIEKLNDWYEFNEDKSTSE